MNLRILLPTLLSLVTAGACAPAASRRPATEYFGPDSAVAAALKARGARPPFSSAVRVGDILYISGQIATRGDGTLPQGIEAQSRQTMDNIGVILARAGAGWDDVVRCLVMIENMADWPAFNTVYVGYFKPDRLPARSALGADGLALGALVEVECQAHLPEKRR